MPDLSILRVHADVRQDQTVTAGTKAWELFRDDTEVIAARVGGELKDLSYDLAEADVVESVTLDSPDGLDILRHSCAHVLAQAVQDLFPDAKLGIGPPIRDGFYYDFDVETPFVPEDLAKIETRMRKIIKDGQRFSRRVTTDADALAELAHEPYKVELIGLKGGAGVEDAAEGASVEVGAGELTIYDNVDRRGETAWSDLCRGPHLPTTKRIPAFKLMRSAAAYWRGDEKNKQLQRLYGTAWASKEDLDAHLHRLEEAERRDHRRLGRDLDLFSFPDEIGSGLPVFHPKGGVIKREMEDYVRRRHIEEGFELRRHPPHLQGGALPHLGAPALLRRGDVPAVRPRRQRVPPQGDELPDAQPDLPLAGPLLPRAAAAALRVRPRLPLREVRRHPRPDPRARLRPGRLPLLRHRRAGAR